LTAVRTEAGVLHPTSDTVGEVPRELPLDDPQGEVDAAGHPANRHEVAVIDDPLVDDLYAKVTEVLLGRAVRASSSTFDQARVSEDQRPGADAADQRARAARRRKQGRPVPPLHLTPGSHLIPRGPAAAGNHEGVGVPRFEGTVGTKSEAVGTADLVGGRSRHQSRVDSRAKVRRRAKDLVWAYRVELVDAVEDGYVNAHSLTVPMPLFVRETAAFVRYARRTDFGGPLSPREPVC